MNDMDLSGFSMRDLFRLEAEGQSEALTAGLLALEQNPHRVDTLEACMRAAHSLKGAARIVDLGTGVALAHAMEELFVAAQEGRTVLDQPQIDHLLKGVDLLGAVANASEADGERQASEVDDYVAELTALLSGSGREVVEAPSQPRSAVAKAGVGEPPATLPAAPNEPESFELTTATSMVVADPPAANRSLRVSADNLNRLVNLAGESLVESRRLKPFTASLLRLKRMQRQSVQAIELVRQSLPLEGPAAEIGTALRSAERQITACRQLLTEQLAELEAADHRATALAHRLYDQARLVRMRPFGEGVTALPRMVRNVGRALGKQVRLEIVGEATQVDRDILDRLEAPVGHLLRNAVDHGIEEAPERSAARKPVEAVIRLEGQHKAGKLVIIVEDDGRGVDIERVREAVVNRKLATEETAARLSESELLDFLFLPGFTLKDGVTDISGRGVGLDVVREMVKQVGGVVRISSRKGRGTRFELQLPLTLSVIHALLLEIGGEPYAISFANVIRAVKVPRSDIRILEGRQYFTFEGRQIGLVAARQILGSTATVSAEATVAVVVIGSNQAAYGIVVDRFLGGRELIVHPLDPRLGKIKDVSAGALMEDGAPLLVLDVEDLVRSAEKLAASDRVDTIRQVNDAAARRRRKKVLVVDDSLTVRELQRKLLDHHGYDVEVAVDGMDGWNAVRSGNFDLVVTDVDMPRMDGIELVSRVKQDFKLSSLPMLILSYKDRDDDRRRGLEAGADYYLTKGSYHSDALIAAVTDLIGEPST